MKDQEDKKSISDKDLEELLKRLLENNLHQEKNQPNKKLFFNVLWQSILLIVLGIISLIILNYTTDIFKNNKNSISEQQEICSIAYPNNCTTEDICHKNGLTWNEGNCLYDTATNNQAPEKINASEYPDFDYYKKLSQNNQKVIAVSNVKSNAMDGEIHGRQKIKLTSSGKFSSAYLYINISVDNGEPLTIWDSLYLTLRKTDYEPRGGHIFRSLSLKTPGSPTTELLFDLRKIPYTYLPYSESNSYSNADWFSLVNNNNQLELESFISTLRTGGEIIEISIAYECEQNSNCNIQILK